MRRLGFFCGALVSLLSLPAESADWNGKTVAQLQTNHPGIDCLYFRLDGVSEADPVLPGSPWFAISGSAPGASRAYAALLAARLAGTTVEVVTDGTMTCGYATAAYVFI